MGGSLEWNGYPNDGHGIGNQRSVRISMGRTSALSRLLRVGISIPLWWLLLGFGQSGSDRKGIGEVGEIWNWREEPPTWR